MIAVHYIGNASIANYTCEYKVANVVGSAVIAVAASNIALSMFFVLRASWTNSWWKRGFSAVLLAGAVSGMHWCAATGTSYYLLGLNRAGKSSRSTIIVVVTVLAFSAAATVAGLAVYGGRVARNNANKARQVVLAAAVFDPAGRILVNQDGLLPSEKITDTYIEKTPSDTFNTENSLFQWMFQASRSWSDIAGVMGSMARHVASLSTGRGRSVRLISDNGQLIENYDVIFRELFCLAAASLATKLKEQLTGIGVLWDEILPTGQYGPAYVREEADDSCERGESISIVERANGLGALMLLVRRLERPQDVEKLEAAGFRFAEVQQVLGIIRTGMQIKVLNLGQMFARMARYASEDTMMESGVHLGCFGIRANVGGQGFDVLVDKKAHNRLPSVKLAIEALEPWQVEFIRQYDGSTILAFQQSLRNASAKQSPESASFAHLLLDATEVLAAQINDRLFDEATLSSRIVHVPCRNDGRSSATRGCRLIAIRLIIPIHYSLNSPGHELIPLSFFRVQQSSCQNSPHHATFAQQLHRELISVVKAARPTELQTDYEHEQTRKASQRWRLRGILSHLRLLCRSRSLACPVDAEGNPIPTRLGRQDHGTDSSRSGSSLKLRQGNGSKMMDSTSLEAESTTLKPSTSNPKKAGDLGGILVSQEITVAVSRLDEVDVGPLELEQQLQDQATPVSRNGRRDSMLGSISNTFEMKAVKQPLGLTVEVSRSTNDREVTFVDELFSSCFEKR